MAYGTLLAELCPNNYGAARIELRTSTFHSKVMHCGWPVRQLKRLRCILVSMVPCKHNLPISFAFDLARLGFEAWMVIGLRTAKLAMGGPAAMLEAQRMVAEKTAAMLESQVAAGMAAATGSSKAAVARKTIAPYRRRVKENRRRLTRKL